MLFLNVSMIVADRVAPSAVPVGSYRLAVSSACLMLKLSLEAKHNPFYQPFKCNSTIWSRFLKADLFSLCAGNKLASTSAFAGSSN